jgi:hypothetical protein
MTEHSNLQVVDEIHEDQVYEVFFQFGEEDPIKMAYSLDGEFSITMIASKETEAPQIIFTDGKGKEFKIFMKK